MRVGVLGGSFDPVHWGHIRPVEKAVERFRLDEVLFVPARLSPLKTEMPADPRHRVAMLALALQGHPGWTIDLRELDREPPSYTVETLRDLRAQRLQDEIFLLMGTDTLAGLARWKEPEEIVRLARIAAYEREPFAGAGLKVPGVAGLAERLEVFDAGSVKISSTGLRADLARGDSAADRVPGPVAEYITKHGLYRSGMAAS
ncbi:MAG TPA: nicotinate (nicotinamide) nucleotide adenylyltransferase [Thermoanaerobaculia bacterium]|jgi:nicotinate-nucleotide adenylyltransferase|nr:nicotinate (nicotinamide) nucleotide adenylyltransferase [Thermoanaerobaculia bacterium]